jgi:hypothetical protein
VEALLYRTLKEGCRKPAMRTGASMVWQVDDSGLGESGWCTGVDADGTEGKGRRKSERG